MPIFYDRIADQVEDLLPDFFQEDGPRFINFLKAYKPTVGASYEVINMI